jgi:glycerol uptake facilitator-like aquaporin
MNKYLVEFLGTMFIIFVVFTTRNWIAISFATAITIFLGEELSNGKGAYNPLIAFSLHVTNRLSNYELILYIIVEIMGALAAFYAYKNLVNNY